MTIVLVGAPGAGKSTVGAELAGLLGKSFTDVDARIEEAVGKPVAEIFADEGEARFRALEESTALELLETGQVVSLGGGAVMNPRIREALAGHDVIWLEVSIQQASRRIGLHAVPPAFGNLRGRLIKLLRERTPVYEAVSTTRVDTDRRAPGEIAVELAEARRQS